MARRKQTARKNKKGRNLANKAQVNGIDKTTPTNNRAPRMNRYRPTALALNVIRPFGAVQQSQVGITADSVGREILFARRIRGVDV